MFLIRAKNNQHEDAVKTYLRTDVTAAGTSLPVENISNFNTSWAVQIGETGEENAELKVVSGTPASGTVNLTAGLTYDHPVDTPIYCYKYNAVVFEQSTAGTAGTATAMTGGTITITPNRFDLDGNSYTVFEDTSGSTTYAYKFLLRNTVLEVNSEESDWIVPAGYDFYTLYELRKRARNKMINKPGDEVIDDWLNEWHETMTNSLIDINKDYALGTTEVTFDANTQYGTITDTDFKFVRRVWSVDSNGTQNVDPMDITDDYPQSTVFSAYRPKYFFRGDDVIGRQPYSAAGTYQIEYYKYNAKLSDDGDTLPLPMRGYTRSYVAYAQSQAAYMDNNEALGVQLETKAESLKQQFIREMNPRQHSGNEYVKIKDHALSVF